MIAHASFQFVMQQPGAPQEVTHDASLHRLLCRLQECRESRCLEASSLGRFADEPQTRSEPEAGMGCDTAAQCCGDHHHGALFCLLRGLWHWELGPFGTWLHTLVGGHAQH